MATATLLAGSLRALMTNLIDYAGLFPPAGLGMPQAVANYAEYLEESSAWMLGRFVVPVGRLDEFEVSAQEYLRMNVAQSPWLLTVLASEDYRNDVGRISRFNENYGPHALIDTFESKVSHPEQISNVISVIPGTIRTYFEIPITGDPVQLISSVREAGGRAKVRTGGLTRESFPASGALVRFIAACVHQNVAFKATAGLHHPVRANYRLTYEDKSEKGMMYGFLNVFLTAAFLKQGMVADHAVRLLEEESAGAFHFLDESVEWHGNRISLDDVSATRKNLAIAFGSCSFHEPIDELHSLHLL